MSRSDAKVALAALVVALLATTPARAADSENVQRARAEFLAATDHVKNARWGEALAAFERSVELRPHALTTFNIGACERALGHYVRARAALVRALEANHAASSRELAPSFVNDAGKWVDEIDGILVLASVKVSPADAVLLVDGSPLTAGSVPGQYVAGFAPAGQKASAPGEKFELLLDPGLHVFSLSRAGFANAVVTKTFTPGSKPGVVLDLQSLPATIHIASDRAASVVTLDDLDVGVAPVEVTRPAGVYHVLVRKLGFVPYEARVKVGPGEAPMIQASLPEEKTPVTKKWWFWTLAAGVVAGAATATYFVARPAPQRPPPDGGGLGWVVSLPGAAR